MRNGPRPASNGSLNNIVSPASLPFYFTLFFILIPPPTPLHPSFPSRPCFSPKFFVPLFLFLSLFIPITPPPFFSFTPLSSFLWPSLHPYLPYFFLPLFSPSFPPLSLPLFYRYQHLPNTSPSSPRGGVIRGWPLLLSYSNFNVVLIVKKSCSVL